MKPFEKVRTLRVEASYGIGGIKSADAEFARKNAKEFVAAVRKIICEVEGMDYQKM